MTRIFDERFEAVGYDETGWSETVGAGSTVDEDFLVSGLGPPSGWGLKGLRTVSTSGTTAYASNSQDVSANNFFMRQELVIVAESLADNEERRLTVMNAGGSTALRLFLRQVSGDLVFRFHVFETTLGSSATVLTDTTARLLNTRYRVEWNWNIDANTWEIKVDGSTIFSGTLVTGAGKPGDVAIDEIQRLGLSNANIDVEIVWDLIAVDDAAYPGAESGAIVVAVGQASETNLAQAFTSTKIKEFAQATETDLAQVMTFGVGIQFAQASEINIARPMFFPVTIADAGLMFIRILTTEVANVVPVEFVTVDAPGVVRVREAIGTLTPIQNVVPVRETLETPRVKVLIA